MLECLKVLFYKPTNGEILINNVNYNNGKDFPPSLRALIENPSFIPDLTGLENLKILADIQKTAYNFSFMTFYKITMALGISMDKLIKKD